MDLSMFLFFIGFSIVLYTLARLMSGWIRLALGWLAGGIFILLGYMIVSGTTITSTTIIDVDTAVITVLDYGISPENMFVFLALVGIVMIFSSSGDWI